MSRDEAVHESLRKKGIEPGDSIEIISEDGRTIRGILMPHHEFSADEITTVKLDSGYNIGVKPRDIDSIRLISKLNSKDRKQKTKIVPSSPKKVGAPGKKISAKLPVVSIVSTGGTIASYVDYRTGAVKPAISADELAKSIPELLEICLPRTEVLYSILSENMRPENWTHLSEKVAHHLNSGSAGCIVPHGTDTMGFSAAALSFSLSNLTGPVVLVGSQRSSDRPSSDSTINLLSSARLCIDSDLGEVVVLMHSTSDDNCCTIHRGTRVRKCHSSRRDAFRSINEDPIGSVDRERILLNAPYDKKTNGKVNVDAKFDPDVALIQFYPSMTIERLRNFVKGAHGVIIAGTGLGHVHQDAIPVIKELTDKDIPVCMTTQCIWGSTNLNVYSTGRDMFSAGAIPLGDMLTETAYVKLSWVLAHAKDIDEVRKLMTSNLRREISDRRTR